MGVWDQLGDPLYMAAMLAHPAQEAVTSEIGQLIRRMRGTGGRTDVRDIQEELVEFVVDVDRRFHEANRRLKRDSATAVEVDFWRRATRQFRAVGDGIAWRFLDYRRQWLIFLGRNPEPGPSTNQRGFGGELYMFRDHWERDEPTVLNAVTNRVTTGDLLVARGETLWAFEVKGRTGVSRPNQKAQRREIEHQINREPRIDTEDGPSWIIESGVPFASYWSEAQPHISRAFDKGAATWVPARGVGVLFTSWRAAVSVGAQTAAENLALEQSKARDALGSTPRSLVIHGHHYPYRPSRAAPYSIFPIDAEHAAALITGELQVLVELDLDVIVESMRERGLRVRSLLGDHPAGPLPDAILQWTDGRVRGVLNRGAVEQLGLELTPVPTWLDALSGTSIPPGPERRWSTYTCFANEGEVWA